MSEYEEKFLNDWASHSHYSGKVGKALICTNFEIPESSLDDATLLYASYTQEDYSGNALVVFERDGKPFLVSGGHCSCYGLEGQWEPEETNTEVLQKMLDGGGSYYSLGASDYEEEYHMEDNREQMRKAIAYLRSKAQ